MKVKLSDYVIDFIASQGVRHAFVVSGGASIHLLHSLHAHAEIEFVCPHHEQAGAMAADGYARASGGLGCAIATSGPGATNMITGIAGAWFDSVPTLYLTGQVTTFRMKGDTGVRQFGFQETEILPMVEPITKYCAQLQRPDDIRIELEKAVHYATTGRPGPVLLDIPDDLQRSFVEVDELAAAEFEPDHSTEPTGPTNEQLDQIVSMLKAAERPVLVLGWGVHLSKGVDIVQKLLERLDVPILTSWAAKHVMSGQTRNYAGTFGTHGTRCGNFTMQNCDLVVSVGARLSTRETGSPLSSWARAAKTVIVDIDPAELAKFPAFDKRLDLSIEADAARFLNDFYAALEDVTLPDYSAWLNQVQTWKKKYPAVQNNGHKDADINPYIFIETLSQKSPEDLQIFADTGCTIAWLMQAFNLKRGQRIFHDFNNTAMGWALPAAVGGSLAKDRAPVLCIAGDGSMMMNVQELATIAHHNLPVRMIVIDNGGYAMVRQTERQWLGGTNAGTSVPSGLGFPDFSALAASFGIPAMTLEKPEDIEGMLGDALAYNGPVLVTVKVPPECGVEPQSKFGYPIEDSEPLLPREVFLSEMIIPPMPISMEPIDQ